MRTKSTEFLSSFIVKQFDITKYRALIVAFLEITHTFEAMLNNEYYKIRFDSSGDLKIGGAKKPTSNQMESMLIRDYQTKEKMQDVLLKYKMAFNNLNDCEKEVFKCTFIEHLKDFDICDELCIYQKKLIQVRNSAIIRFCLFLGIDMFLDKYIKENGKLTDYGVFKEDGISGIVTIPVSDLFLAQFKNGIYNAVDVVVKYMAIENYYGCNNNGFNLYNKMQRMRIKENWEERFKNLINEIERNGYSDESLVETDINYSIHDGAHRLAMALFMGIKNINVRVFNTDLHRRDYDITWFINNGFTAEEINQIQEKLNEILKKINEPYYCIFWTPARNIFHKLEHDIVSVEDGVFIQDKKVIELPRNIFKKFIYEIYSTDDIAPYKLDLKYQHLMASLEKDNFSSDYLPIEVVSTILDIPDFKMKGLTGLPQSKKTMRLKKQVRAKNCDLISDYYYDIIMHMTDNNIQNEDVKLILRKVNNEKR